MAKTGSSTSTSGKKKQTYNKRKYEAGAITLGQAATRHFATQKQLRSRNAKRALARDAARKKWLGIARSRSGRKFGFTPPGCREQLSIYGFTQAKTPGVRTYKRDRSPQQVTASQGKFLCKVPPYRERRYTSQPNEYRVFIEGAEVTSYVRDALTWDIQSTGGMNSARFVLNNDADAFIITPANVCSNLNLAGWRVGRDKRGRLVNYPGREGARFDEAAKYEIYRRKYKIVAPGTKDAQIDETGMWLYPLNPFSVIFNKHDACRIFYRLSHISATGRKIGPRREGWELWAPGFTGFLRNISWHDDPVMGDRYVSIEAYDYRGLLDRMRVRTAGLRTTTTPANSSGKAKDSSSTSPVLSGLTLDANLRKFLTDIGLINQVHTLYEVLLTLELTKCGQQPAKTCIVSAERAANTEAKKNLSQAMNLVKKLDAINRKLTQRKKGAYTFKRNTSDASKFDFIPDPTKKGVGYDTLENLTRFQRDLYKVYFDSSFGIVNGWEDPLPKTAGKSAATLEKVAVSIGQSSSAIAKSLGVTDVNTERNNLLKEVIKRYSGEAISPEARNILQKNAKLWGLNSNGAPDPTKPVDFLSYSKADLTKRVNSILASIKTTRSVSDTPSYSTIANQGEAIAAQLTRLDISLTQRIKAANTQTSEASSQQSYAALRKAKHMVRRIKDLRKQGQNKQARTNAGNLGDLYLKQPTYEGQIAGIFDDLIKEVTQGSPHPLANMTFEQAVDWLICERTNMVRGVYLEVERYKPKVFQEWNRNVLFGMLGRPLTFDEVTTIGKLTTSDFLNDTFSPINGFLHLMLPATGTGANTIVQGNMSMNQANVVDHVYETRYSLLNMICELLDYKFFMSPMGDAVFEFPNYNVVPDDYGPMFSGAYKVALEWMGGDINDEATDLNTGWVITGNEDEAIAGQVQGERHANERFYKISIMAPILAKRLGVKVENIRINLPGVGSQITQGDKRGGLDALRVWGLIHIQKQLGQAHTVTAKFPFRPFLVPNRPIHLKPRMRIGLIDTVSYSMKSPDGEATCDVQLNYIRMMHRDGQFRNIAGGHRMPVDYSGFYTGIQSYRVKEGVTGDISHVNPYSYSAYKAQKTITDAVFKLQGKKSPRQHLSFSCAPALRDAWYEAAQSYGDDMSAFATQGFRYSDSTAGTLGNPQDPDSYLETGALLGTDQGMYGQRVRRGVNNPPGTSMDNSPGPATTKGTGLIESGGRVGKAKRAPKSKAKYDLKRLFHNPYPYAMAKDVNSGRFNAWFSRYLLKPFLTGWKSGTQVGSKYAWHRAKAAPHAGIDIIMPIGTPLLAPIRLFGVSATIWVGARGEGKEPFAYVTVNNQEVSKAEIFAVRKGGKPVMSPEKAGSTSRRILVYTKPYKAWKRTEKRVRVKRGHAAKGLNIYGFGWVKPPKTVNDPTISRNLALSGSKGLYCRLSFKHCHTVELGKSKRRPIRSADRGVQIGKVGTTGTGTPHVHLDMWIVKNQYKFNNRGKAVGIRHSSDNELFKEAAAANREYIETLLLMKVTGGKPKSGNISPEWQKYFKAQGIKVQSVKEAVAFLAKVKKTDRYYDTGRNELLTNAFLYFRPEEICPGSDRNVGKAYTATFYDTAAINKESGAGDGKNRSFCGALASIQFDALRKELNTCVGKALRQGIKKNRYGYYRARRCRKKYKKNLKIAFAKAKQTKGRNLAKKLDAATDRTLQTKGRGASTDTGSAPTSAT